MSYSNLAVLVEMSEMKLKPKQVAAILELPGAPDTAREAQANLRGIGRIDRLRIFSGPEDSEMAEIGQIAFIFTYRIWRGERYLVGGSVFCYPRPFDHILALATN